jgi:hypothetical protein
MSIALFFATFAVRHPKLFSFLKRFGKWIGLALAVAGVAWASLHWFNGKLDAADKAGFHRAETQFS